MPMRCSIWTPEASEFLTHQSLAQRRWTSPRSTSSFRYMEQPSPALHRLLLRELRFCSGMTERATLSPTFAPAFAPSKDAPGSAQTNSWFHRKRGSAVDHPDIPDPDWGRFPSPAIVLRQAIAALFELDEVLVMGAIVNSAAENQTASHSWISGKTAPLFHAAARPARMTPSAGYTFAWTNYATPGDARTGRRWASTGSAWIT